MPLSVNRVRPKAIKQGMQPQVDYITVADEVFSYLHRSTGLREGFNEFKRDCGNLISVEYITMQPARELTDGGRNV